jgi:hypothetical protein
MSAGPWVRAGADIRYATDVMTAEVEVQADPAAVPCTSTGALEKRVVTRLRERIGG